MTDSESFVCLKYEIITRHATSWHLCATYPPEVLEKWAWDCVDDACATNMEYCPNLAVMSEVAHKYRENWDTLQAVSEMASVFMSGAMIADNLVLAYKCAGEVTYYLNHGESLEVIQWTSSAGAAVMWATRMDTHKWDKYVGWLISRLGKYHE